MIRATCTCISLIDCNRFDRRHMYKLFSFAKDVKRKTWCLVSITPLNEVSRPSEYIKITFIDMWKFFYILHITVSKWNIITFLCWNVGVEVLVRQTIGNNNRRILCKYNHISFQAYIMYIPEKKTLETRPRFLTPFFFSFYFSLMVRAISQLPISTESKYG